MKSLTLSVLSGNASLTWDDLGNTPIGSSGSAVNIILRPGFCFFDMLLHNLPGGCHEQELSNACRMVPSPWRKDRHFQTVYLLLSFLNLPVLLLAIN